MAMPVPEKTQCAKCKAEVGKIEKEYSAAHGFLETLCFPCANRSLLNLADVRGRKKTDSAPRKPDERR